MATTFGGISPPEESSKQNIEGEGKLNLVAPKYADFFKTKPYVHENICCNAAWGTKCYVEILECEALDHIGEFAICNHRYVFIWKTGCYLTKKNNSNSMRN
ncbi:hypothetical protein FXO38_08405 [Capsicum annuum]|nr:hypothetical protein FXO37_13851 [Capsicum annuum]KAF3667814.1 hypothetical protein FXO38_08405 [Capsicum annuum]